jgi:hypothetical protein
VRILLVLALLGVTASCVVPQPEAPPPPPAPVVLAPAPVPVVAAVPVAAVPEPVTAVYVPTPLAWLFGPPAPAPGRLTLSNFSYDNARVQTVITPYPDCVARPDTATGDFAMPLNATRIVAAIPGADVCWRRALPTGPSPTIPGVEIISGWTEWNRVFTASGRSIDSQL